MTLTRTPCELDKMSLFQDLKLKRRKVDSRCSSDGKNCILKSHVMLFGSKQHLVEQTFNCGTNKMFNEKTIVVLTHGYYY